jgi:16S rRNA (guanine527-N7)-methyltransferase
MIEYSYRGHPAQKPPKQIFLYGGYDIMENEAQRPRQILAEGAAALGITLSDAQLDTFSLYTKILIGYNEKVNLTAITDPAEIALKHYVDSLCLLKYAGVPQGAAVADVGSGAGFPGAVLKIARSDIRLTCIDGLNKRVVFLDTLSAGLGIREGFRSIHQRGEEAGRVPGLRGCFDVVTARAVARLDTLAEYCLPLVKTGGIFCAMKGPDSAEEAGEAKRAIGMLGGKVIKCESYLLPGTDMGRTLIIIKKIRDTPSKYPRPTAQIKKHSL